MRDRLLVLSGDEKAGTLKFADAALLYQMKSAIIVGTESYRGIENYKGG